MKLIGMLDSPYVRRVAIALDCLGVPFEHEPLSVFTTYDRFRAVNPVVKAPTLVGDDGEVLMDSTLILDYVEATRAGAMSLWPMDDVELRHDYRALGLALAACDKCVQYVYEHNLRPAAARHAPWSERVLAQARAAYAGLEQEIARRPAAFAECSHASLMAAVAWGFTQSTMAAEIPASEHPGLVALAARLEATAPFLRYPPAGPGVPGP